MLRSLRTLWSSGRIDGRDYEVYVRYIPSESLPPNKDGEVLGLSKAGLDRNESLRLHDGGDNFWFTETSGEFLSLAGMLKQWKRYRQAQRQGDYATETEDWQASDIEGPIKPIFWNTKRIPVTDNSGDHWTLDLDPPEDGAYGPDPRPFP